MQWTFEKNELYKTTLNTTKKKMGGNSEKIVDR